MSTPGERVSALAILTAHNDGVMSSADSMRLGTAQAPPPWTDTQPSLGINPKDAFGIKKPPLFLVPAALLLWVSKVFGFSSGKYGPYNWRDKKVNKSVYLGAIERHLLALKDGQDNDPETGLPHMAHIAANCAIILDATALGMVNDDMVWRKGPAPRLIVELTEK